MKAKSKPMAQKTPEDYGVDVTPRLTTTNVREPSKREAGVKVASVDELIDRPDYACAPTYEAVAERLGVHVGTVYQTLRRLRVAHPNLHKHVSAVRLWQLDERHRDAFNRERAARKAAKWPERHQRYRGWQAGIARPPWARRE